MTTTSLHGVTKRYGSATALDDVSFAVRDGDVAALLGPNGAGKSTALSILLGLRRPDRGKALLLGGDPRDPRVRRAVGVTPQETLFPQTLRVLELVELVRAHFPLAAPASETLERFGAAPLARRQVGGLSVGQRRLVGVALAFVGAPRLVVLDEPTAGLDLEARKTVWRAVRAHASEGGGVLLTTHHLDEAEELATRVVLLDNGKVVADAAVGDLKRAAGLTRVSFRATNGAVEGAVLDGAFVRILTPDGGATVARLVRDGVSLAGLEVRPATLEEAIAVVGGERR